MQAMKIASTSGGTSGSGPSAGAGAGSAILRRLAGNLSGSMTRTPRHSRSPPSGPPLSIFFSCDSPRHRPIVRTCAVSEWERKQCSELPTTPRTSIPLILILVSAYHKLLLLFAYLFTDNLLLNNLYLLKSLL